MGAGAGVFVGAGALVGAAAGTGVGVSTGADVGTEADSGVEVAGREVAVAAIVMTVSGSDEPEEQAIARRKTMEKMAMNLNIRMPLRVQVANRQTRHLSLVRSLRGRMRPAFLTRKRDFFVKATCLAGLIYTIRVDAVNSIRMVTS